MRWIATVALLFNEINKMDFYCPSSIFWFAVA